jgi:hypothetical protein
MFHRNQLVKTISNNHGFGLIAAIFVIVILAVFGLLVARFTGTGALESAEDYLWAQAYYSAQSAAQSKILCNDNGGGIGVCATPTTISTFTITVNDTFSVVGSPAIVRVQAERTGINVSRTLEVKYIL